MTIKFCNTCLLPNTKPGLYFRNGKCSACLEYENRKNIDWESRKNEFSDIVAQVKSKKGYYDCIIPVSGGKDSHYQVIKAMEHGLHPLAVNVAPCDPTEIGKHNLENIGRLGCDLIRVNPNPRVRARLNKYALEKVGDISWPEHKLIFTVPFNLAREKGIDLIIWGENSQNEYGAGPKDSAEKNTLDKRWVDEFGGFNGLRLNDFIDAEIVSEKESIPYLFEGELYKIKSLFLGYYFPWDGATNALIASSNGFEMTKAPVIGNLTHYENLDNRHTGIHDHIKFLKFGFSRVTDIQSTLIRRGKVTREKAISVVVPCDGEYPFYYIDSSLEQILEKIGMSIEEYNYVCEKFINKDLFEFNASTEIVHIRRKYKVGACHA